MTTVEDINKKPTIQYWAIRGAFAPDQEISHAAKLPDLAVFGTNWAYTLDGWENQIQDVQCDCGDYHFPRASGAYRIGERENAERDV
jgi:hypothetical protein